MSDLRQLEDTLFNLVRRAQAGDVAARDDVLRRCHGTIYRWALVHTAGDADEADDIAQEVLLRLLRSLHRYAGRSRFTTWLYQVTRNAALGWRRRLSGRLRVIERFAREPDAAREEAVQEVERTEIGAVVAALFHQLPRRQREVFHLADIEGVPLVEIAARMGLNAGTARAHLFRARRTLRARILERHPELVEEDGR